MGKRLIIRGADFSANAVDYIPGGRDLLNQINDKLLPRVSLNGYTDLTGENNASTIQNEKRSCIFAEDVSTFAVLGYTKITVNLKAGFDMVLGIGTTNHTAEYYSGDCVAGKFTWITNSQSASCPLSNTKKYLYINIRHDDNTTAMDETGVASDYIDSIELS